ncbi:Mitochondrial/chloroplast ribosomal protein L5/L7 [Phaffia rhodozyma]|uniref:Mitochondrial/chloroplast ribosomal protein L5/L7 n=1 Tax=Phaffia rhodozyma TaxID=264483 RepID=A0A0F7SUJ2_PHARH|nr:Mitochondrial/chloroplast ribosomal protein L5/L7 [Phaffia rhodozyma]
MGVEGVKAVGKERGTCRRNKGRTRFGFAYLIKRRSHLVPDHIAWWIAHRLCCIPLRLSFPLFSFASYFILAMAFRRSALSLSSFLPSVSSSSLPVLSRAAFGTTPTLSARTPKPKAATTVVAPKDETPLPPLPEIFQGPIESNRLKDFYQNVLTDDLLYLTYSHRIAINPDLPRPNLSWVEKDPTNPFAANRHHPQPGGARSSLLPTRHGVDEYTIPRLERISINMFVRESIGKKASLLGPLHSLRTITGQVKNAGNDVDTQGVEIIRGKKGAAAWSLRAGMPVGAKITLKGDDMYRFVESLTEFVLPRIREWPGVKMLPLKTKEEPESVSSTSGVVTFGLDRAALALFPQIEACLDVYPRLTGMHISFITNQRGLGAQNRARMLLSGFRFPFYQPEKQPKKKGYQVVKKRSKK